MADRNRPYEEVPASPERSEERSGSERGWRSERGQRPEQGWQARPEWEQHGRGYGSGAGWELDEQGMQSEVRNRPRSEPRSWVGPGRSYGDYDFDQSRSGQGGQTGYGPGGYTGYGSRAGSGEGSRYERGSFGGSGYGQGTGPDSGRPGAFGWQRSPGLQGDQRSGEWRGASSSGPRASYGEHGGGYGSEASYSNQGRGVGYGRAHEESRWERRPGHEWRGDEHRYGEGWRDREDQREHERDPGWNEPGSLRHDPWMGEGFGGPAGPVRRERWQPDAQETQRRWPKSYTRSDDRIREDLYERVMQHDHIDASEVTISVEQGKVTLEGSVPERHMKHDIENVVDACPGVKDILNHLRVARHSGGTSESQGFSTDTSTSTTSTMANAKPGGGTSSQAWGRSQGPDEHGDRTTGGASSYTANTETAAPSGTRSDLHGKKG